MRTSRSQHGFFVCVALTTCLGSVQAQEQDFRVGFVDTSRVIRESEPAIEVQVGQEHEFDALEHVVAAQSARVSAAVEKLSLESASLPEAVRAGRRKQISKLSRDLQQAIAALQEGRASRKSEATQQVLDRANRVIRHIAQVEGYTLVLEDVVYVNPKHDITDKVIQALNTSNLK